MTIKRIALGLLAGFLASMIANTVLALVVLAPINDDLGIARTTEQGLNYPALMIGYLVLAAVLVWTVNHTNQPNWLKRGALAGFVVGAGTFIAGHLITTGWSIAKLAPMAYSGIIDTIAAIIGGIAVSRAIQRGNAANGR